MPADGAARPHRPAENAVVRHGCGPAAQTGAWGAFLEKITAPHVRRDNPRQAELIEGLDAAMAQLLRDILHHPDFQALESLWRGVKLLTRRLETGTELTLELIDLPRAASRPICSRRRRSTPAPSTSCWSSRASELRGAGPGHSSSADFTFGPSRREMVLLWRLGQIARLAGAPFLAAASPRMVGCESLAATPDPDDWPSSSRDEGWSDLRQSGEAPYLGLALPRFLLRAPYGRSVLIDRGLPVRGVR